MLISIHALRAEGDSLYAIIIFIALLFLSTPSVRRATGSYYFAFTCSVISIHALRAEGD